MIITVVNFLIDTTTRSSTKKSNQDFPLLSTVDLTDLINKINMIYEYSHDAYKEVLELDTKLSNLNKKVTQIQKSNIHRKVSQYPHEFAKIYTSKSVKTSLNLNENVKNRILELMKERFDEEDKSSKKGKKDKESKCNDSKLINAALLLALYYVDQEQNESDI